MKRRFLNLISRCGDGLYSVNHLDTSHLFYKSAAAAARNGNTQISSIGEIPQVRRLPAASFAFQPFRSNMYHIIKGVDVFSPFGENKILCADGVGYATAYDTSSRSTLGMPMMNAPKGPMHTVISSIPRTEEHVFSAEDFEFNATDKLLFQSIVNGDHTESLYVMDMSPRNHLSFEVLTFSSKGWIWRPLPQPLFFGDPRYKPSSYDSCTVVNGNTIFVSPSMTPPEESNVGTYCFDTVTQEWDRAGEWVLPFLGKTEHVPEFGLWFGLSAHEPYHLCAISSLDPPTVKHVWPDFNPPEGWSLLDLTLLSQGSGRFCTAKFFDVSVDISDTDDDDAFDSVLILTGVEVVRSDDDQAGGFKMIRHKSKCVSSLDVACVL